MDTPGEILVGLTILLGIAGVFVPVLPGALLVIGAVLVWAAVDGSTAAWVTFTLAVTFVAISTVGKYVFPGRRMREAGVPSRTLLVGGLAGAVGFFVIPFIGLFIGFVLGVYAAERARLPSEMAWPSTKLALKAVGLSVVIELAGTLLAAATWLTSELVFT
ncbi:MAG: DUF456 domain-containing protein [Propionibacteriales bacterium]|nr:DUF456 domain-containing protein [Propionibacteriales bacterium]